MPGTVGPRDRRRVARDDETGYRIRLIRPAAVILWM
jgi:hypothetical protein